MPKHRYPNGYKVTTQNCTIISGPPNNQKLLVTNKMDIEGLNAEVTITPLSAK